MKLIYQWLSKYYGPPETKALHRIIDMLRTENKIINKRFKETEVQMWQYFKERNLAQREINELNASLEVRVRKADF